ncbi:MAG: adenylate/guanylate cyclase domain-containing protein [Spirochaetes bacterium]|nr:MAG: adenylate/guanylate cyclase domain-containing protein [Spirochaetota bacterium]
MKKDTKRLILMLVIGFFSALVMVVLSNLTFFENLEHKLTDFRFALRGPNYEGIKKSNIVIVAIDDQSIASIPYKYPWPRTYHAKLVENLKKAGARIITFDIEFTEKSRIDPKQDVIFRDAIEKAGNVVLAGKMMVKKSGNYEMISLLEPIDILREVAPYGIVDTKFDSDGFVRRYILFRDYNNLRYLSLGLQTIASYMGLKGNQMDWLKQLPNGDFIIGNRYKIKKYDNLPSAFINYYGPANSFKTISYEQVIDDKGFKLLLDKNTFKDKIVLVGSTVTEHHDLFSTPFYISGGEMLTPGVEIHANFIQSVLDQNFISGVNIAIVYFISFIFALSIAYLIKRTKPLIGIASSIVIGIVYFVINIMLFINFNILMNLITPTTAIGLAFVACSAYQYFSEEKEKIYIRSVFKHYLAENVVDTVLQETDALSFGGKKQHLTVLFSDIRSFTSYSEKYSPEEVVSILGEYLTEMVDIILKYGGMLDKFVGDEIMAVFGAPHYFKDHAEKACLTALEMIRALDRLKEKWEQEGRDTFDIGIGINTGDMIVGNLGSKQIFDYTVIGDAVNLGARLEGINKVYPTVNHIILSEYTKNEISDNLVTRELDSVRVKGKRKPVAIYELVGEREVMVYPKEFLKHFEKGLFLYKRMKWEEASEEFKKALSHRDDEISKMYIKRCKHFMKYPPAPDWDGVFTLKTK